MYVTAFCSSCFVLCVFYTVELFPLEGLVADGPGGAVCTRVGYWG